MFFGGFLHLNALIMHPYMWHECPDKNVVHLHNSDGCLFSRTTFSIYDVLQEHIYKISIQRFSHVYTAADLDKLCRNVHVSKGDKGYKCI